MAREELPVLIAGAGPGGLAAAVALAQRDVPVVVVESEPELPIDLRAGAFHPPTIEMLDDLGVGDAFRAKGIVTRKWQVRDKVDGLVAEFDLQLLARDTRYPFRLHCEQWKLTRLLQARLATFPHARLHFSSTFLEARDAGGRIVAEVAMEDGHRTIEASYLIGADGARSAVRRCLGIEFEGFTWPERYLVASTDFDLSTLGYASASYISDPVEWCAVMNMPHHGGSGIWRLATPIEPEITDEEALEPSFVRGRVNGFEPRLAGCAIPYCSIYKVHQRVAATFVAGRCILVGDAAHINNPMGGMGVNSSIHDAVNLAAKLSAVWHGEVTGAEADDLLALYSRQRRQVNIEFVQAISIRNKRMMEEKDPAVRLSRLDEMRSVASTPEKAYRFLLDTSMIASLRRAAQIE